MPKPNVPCKYDSNSWNDDDVKAAWKAEPWDENHQWMVYAASKTEAEKALWKFRDEKRPHFTINSVLPATNFGPVITPDTVSSTANFVPMIYGGNVEALLGVLPRKSYSFTANITPADNVKNTTSMSETLAVSTSQQLNF